MLSLDRAHLPKIRDFRSVYNSFVPAYEKADRGALRDLLLDFVSDDEPHPVFDLVDRMAPIGEKEAEWLDREERGFCKEEVGLIDVGDITGLRRDEKCAAISERVGLLRKTIC